MNCEMEVKTGPAKATYDEDATEEPTTHGGSPSRSLASAWSTRYACHRSTYGCGEIAGHEDLQWPSMHLHMMASVLPVSSRYRIVQQMSHVARAFHELEGHHAKSLGVGQEQCGVDK
jgi:hypothetical protein